VSRLVSRVSAPLRPLRIAGRLAAAARHHGAPLPRVAVHAFRQTRRGWRLGEMAMLGLLDPDRGPDAAPWAVRAAEFERLQEALNPPEHVPVCEDKRRFADFCERAGLPSPRLLAVLERGEDPAATVLDWSRVLAAEGARRDIVVKPADGHRGVGVRVLGRSRGALADHRGRPLDPVGLARRLAADPWPAYVVEERVRPHPAMRELTGHDYLNTLRIVTLAEEGAPARIVGRLWRIGTGNEPVDSFRSGSTRNLCAEVGEDGRVGVPLALAPSGFGLEPVPVHPATGKVVQGWRVPDWDLARDTALRAAEALRELPSVGWDVAVTDRGPMVIEGNAWWAWLCDPRATAEPPVVTAHRRAVARTGAPAGR
jgi:Sugar-transfer associated ATP-grasp